MHSSKQSNEIKGEEGGRKTLKNSEKLKTPQPPHTVKLPAHLKAHTSMARIDH